MSCYETPFPRPNQVRRLAGDVRCHIRGPSKYLNKPIAHALCIRAIQPFGVDSLALPVLLPE